VSASTLACKTSTCRLLELEDLAMAVMQFKDECSCDIAFSRAGSIV
jgi:hypothetical protein